MSSRWSGFRDAMDVVEESAMLHNHKKSSRGQFCRLWRSRVWTFLFFGFLEDAVLVDVLVPRVGKRFAEDNKVISVLQECIREGTEEDQNPVPFVPHERFLERLVEVIVDIPVPLIQEDIPEVIQVLSEQCVSEQLVDVPVPRIQEELVEMVQSLSEQIMEGAHVECFICFRIVCGIHRQRECLRTLRVGSPHSSAPLRA